MKTLLAGVLFSVRPPYACDTDMFLNRGSRTRSVWTHLFMNALAH